MYVLSNGGEKIKLKEEAIHEILVADTNSESGAEVIDFDDFEEEKNNNNNNYNKNSSSSSKPQQKSNHRLQQVVDYQPGDLNEGTQIFILLSVQQKV